MPTVANSLARRLNSVSGERLYREFTECYRETDMLPQDFLYRVIEAAQGFPLRNSAQMNFMRDKQGRLTSF
jgi:hypothetical protein